jgi:hypothetical protein
MAAEWPILEAILKIIGIVVPVISTVVGGVIWVVKRIEKGQNKLWKKYRKLSETHRHEITEITNELAEKVNLSQCENFRQKCPGCSIFNPALTNNEIFANNTNRRLPPTKKRKKRK